MDKMEKIKRLPRKIRIRKKDKLKFWKECEEAFTQKYRKIKPESQIDDRSENEKENWIEKHNEFFLKQLQTSHRDTEHWHNALTESTKKSYEDLKKAYLDANFQEKTNTPKQMEPIYIPTIEERKLLREKLTLSRKEKIRAKKEKMTEVEKILEKRKGDIKFNPRKKKNPQLGFCKNCKMGGHSSSTCFFPNNAKNLKKTSLKITTLIHLELESG
jgi:hypothetical protein